MSPLLQVALELAVKTTVLLAALVATLRFFGVPLLTQSIRTALGPELSKLAKLEVDLTKLRDDHDGLAVEHRSLGEGLLQRRSELDRRMASHQEALSQLPVIRSTLDHLSAEMGRSNVLNERGMDMIQALGLQVARMQGQWEQTQKGGA